MAVERYNFSLLQDVFVNSVFNLRKISDCSIAHHFAYWINRSPIEIKVYYIDSSVSNNCKLLYYPLYHGNSLIVKLVQYEYCMLNNELDFNLNVGRSACEQFFKYQKYASCYAPVSLCEKNCLFIPYLGVVLNGVDMLYTLDVCREKKYCMEIENVKISCALSEKKRHKLYEQLCTSDDESLKYMSESLRAINSRGEHEQMLTYENVHKILPWLTESKLLNFCLKYGIKIDLNQKNVCTALLM